MNMRLPLSVIIFFGLCTIAPKISSANPLWYGSILSVDGDHAKIEFKTLETKQLFSCSIATLTCDALPEKPLFDTVLPNLQPDLGQAAPSPADSETPKAPSTKTAMASPFRFPRESSRQNPSPSGRFGFFVIENERKGVRSVNLIDRVHKKTYAVSGTLRFWNLFEEQPRISRFAPDESTLTYLDDRSGFASLYVVDLKNLSQKKFQSASITSGVSVGDFKYADAHTLMYVANTKTDPYNWTLYAYNLATKKRAIMADHLAYDTTLYQSNNSILFVRMGELGTLPSILADYHATTDPLVRSFTLPVPQPTSTEGATYTYQKIAGMNTVSVVNRDSGNPVHPLIVWLHGGPYRQASFIRHPYISYGVYDWALEQAAHQGAYVLKIDYPGSYGAGRSFTESIKYNVGLTDVRAVENVIKDFVAHNKTNGVYLTGNSYGGYLALRMATAYPEQIAGVLSINGVTDWGSLLDFYDHSIFNTFFNGVPSRRNKKLFDQASILDRVTKLTMPTYIVQGEADSTIPKFQAVTLKNTLDTAGHTNAVLTLIPGENHVFDKASSMNTICQTLFTMIGFNANGSCRLER